MAAEDAPLASPDPVKPLLLVDGSSYLFRAYHALPKLTTSSGFPTGAVRGVVAMLRKLAKDYEGSPIAVVFDAKGTTFRNTLYPEYKGNRPAMPDDLRPQIEPIHAIIRAMGLPLLIVPDVEADDVIGTLTCEATAQRRHTVVSTGDKDMTQLVSDYVTLVNTMTETVLDRAGVAEKFGVPPERIVDYLALMGDSVDNIPGVPKVGPKTAAKWLQVYGSLDEVIARADEIKGKVGESLRASLDQLPLSRELTRIRCDLELDVGIADLVPSEPDEAALTELFERYEFRTWRDELDGADPTASPPSPSGPRDYRIIETWGALDAWIGRIAAARLVAVHVETTSPDYMVAELVGLSFCVAPGEAAYLPIGHAEAPAQLERAAVLERLRPLLEDAQVAKVGHNLKYTLSVFARHGIALRGVAHDAMLQSYVLNSVSGRHGLDDLARRCLGIRPIPIEDVAGKGAKQIGFDQVAIERAYEFAAQNADLALQLHRCQWPQLEAIPALVGVYQDLEIPLLHVLSRIERNGALVDGAQLEAFSHELAERMEALKQRACAAAGEDFNLDSPKQLQVILYEKLGLPQLKKTPKGQPSTAEPVLQDLARDFELPRLILDYRTLAKLKSTYADKLPLQINADTKRIHTTYHQAVAATGRLSSSDPNLQNIPIRHSEGRRIRAAFVAPRGRRIVAADYSQIELRIMAHLSGDEGLLKAFADDLDIHRATAAEVFGAPLEAVTDEQRRRSKAINFGLIYGMSAFGLARQINVSRALAQDYIERYFERYPGVRRYMEATRALAHDQGFVETVFGRRLYLPEIRDRNQQRRQAAERTAINAPMQGSAADIIKRAMLAVDAWLAGAGLEALMIMQVHDELVFEVAEHQVDALVSGVRERMQGAADLRVPLVVDVGVGDNWDEAH